VPSNEITVRPAFRRRRTFGHDEVDDAGGGLDRGPQVARDGELVQHATDW
jgi:hypothetical protein